MLAGLSTKNKGLIFGMLGVAGFSLTLPMTRLAVVNLDPAQVIIWRGFLASILAILMLVIRRPPIPPRSVWKAIFLAGFGTLFGFSTFMTLGMTTVSASHGAVVIGLLPLATAIFAVLIGREKPSLGFWIMSAVGTIITLTFVLRQAEGGMAVGHIFLLLAVVFASMGYSFGAQASKVIGGWQTTCWSLAVAMPFLLVAMACVPMITPAAGAVSLSALVYLALVSQFAAFFAWYRGLAMAGVARVSQVQLLQLFMTVTGAYFILNEKFDPEVILFGSLVVVVVWMGTKMRIESTQV